jgi:ABC-type Fe3+-hydroxamate transport system substrate-binding protein
MQRKLILTALILSSALSANAMADDTAAGAVVGGGIGAIVGHAMGGRNGAIVGGVLGAVVGSSVASDNQNYRHGDQNYAHDDDYNNGYAVSYSHAVPVTYAPPPPPRVVYVNPPVYEEQVAYRPAPVVYVSQGWRPPVYRVRYEHDGWRHHDRDDDRGDWHDHDGRGWGHEHDRY